MGIKSRESSLRSQLNWAKADLAQAVKSALREGVSDHIRVMRLADIRKIQEEIVRIKHRLKGLDDG